MTAKETDQRPIFKNLKIQWEGQTRDEWEQQEMRSLI